MSGADVVSLATLRWRRLPGDRGYKYVGRAGTAGGIRTIVLETRRNAGRERFVSSGASAASSTTTARRIRASACPSRSASTAGASCSTYCLIGWRASVAWLALTWLGFDDVRVYDGSWLEWGAGGFPVETGS